MELHQLRVVVVGVLRSSTCSVFRCVRRRVFLCFWIWNDNLRLGLWFPAATDDLVDEVEEVGAADGGEVGIVGEGLDDFFSGDVLGSAPGVDTVFYFPKNPEKSKSAVLLLPQRLFWSNSVQNRTIVTQNWVVV